MDHHHRMRRLIASVVVASVATLSIAGAAAAHECFNDSRTARADANAARSNGWTWASEILLRFVIPGILADPAGLSEEQLSAALSIVEAERASGVAVYQFDRAMLEHATAMGGKGAYGGPKSDDGHAIEHATVDEAEFGPLVGHLIGVYMTVKPPA